VITPPEKPPAPVAEVQKKPITTGFSYQNLATLEGIFTSENCLPARLLLKE
jgi:hypothetical protein